MKKNKTELFNVTRTKLIATASIYFLSPFVIKAAGLDPGLVTTLDFYLTLLFVSCITIDSLIFLVSYLYIEYKEYKQKR